MEAKNGNFYEKSQRGFKVAQKKIFWLELRARMLTVMSISTLFFTAELLVRDNCNAWLPMTEKDIAVFTRIDANYFIPIWWDLLFVVIWSVLLCWMGASKWFKEETGPIMRNLLIALVIGGGIYFSVVYGGMLYGLIISFAFLVFLVALILASPLLSRILFE